MDSNSVRLWNTHVTDDNTARQSLDITLMKSMYTKRACSLLQKYGQKFVPAPRVDKAWLQEEIEDVIVETWRKIEWSLKSIPDKVTRYPYIKKGTHAYFNEEGLGEWLHSERLRTKDDCAKRLLMKKNTYGGMSATTVQKILTDAAKAHLLPMECDKNHRSVLVSCEPSQQSTGLRRVPRPTLCALPVMSNTELMSLSEPLK
jgi:hypothetical protein